MSILLDALKKSESQRQLGKTPTIHSTVEAPDAERESEQQWIVLSMLALSALAIAWFGWQQFSEPVGEPDKVAVDALAVPEVAEIPVPAAEPGQGKKDRKRPASLWNLQRDQAGLTIQPATSPEKTGQRRKTLNRSFSTYEAEQGSAGGQQAKPPLTNLAATSSGPVTDQSGELEKALLTTPVTGSSQLQPHQSEPISFWQIPQALRDDMPDLRINVLVYAEKPEDRFLLINGQRLVEKEELAAGIVLDEIRRDGAIFRYRKYRFLVKG